MVQSEFWKSCDCLCFQISPPMLNRDVKLIVGDEVFFRQENNLLYGNSKKFYDYLYAVYLVL